jgi:hypothetical protein
MRGNGTQRKQQERDSVAKRTATTGMGLRLTGGSTGLNISMELAAITPSLSKGHMAVCREPQRCPPRRGPKPTA